MKIFKISALFTCLFAVASWADEIPRTASKPGTTLAILAPADGAVVKSPVTVQFGLDGMGVAPAGVPATTT